METSLGKTAKLTNGIEVDLTLLFDLIKKQKNEGNPVSVTSYFIKVCAKALRMQPDLNVKYFEEEYEILFEEKINIGFAVETDKGLFAPVLKDAEKKT